MLIYVRGKSMESIKSVEEFKKYMKDNCNLVRENITYADEITLDDEWMQDNVWDEIYQKEVVNNGKI